MNKILILFITFASFSMQAQSNWEVSVCDGNIIHEGNRYEVLDNILTENIQGDTPREVSFFCLSNDITINDNHNRYYRWYHNSNERRVGNPTNRLRYYSYTFPNSEVEIRAYPDGYAGGQHSFAGRFVVWNDRNGRNISSSNSSRFRSAQSAWRRANR